MSKDLILPQLHGVLVLNKPKGPTSNFCLQKIKRLGQKKIGHAGTLDPMASGVLLCLLGQATKLSNYLMQQGSKIYKGTILLGQTTDTWDLEGQVLQKNDLSPLSIETLYAEIAAWVDLKEQPVPPYSAAKLNGQPLYKMARSGQMIERTKTIHIFKTELISYEHPYVNFRVTCSTGTYIRSLAHSLGMRLGCGAVLADLVREYSYPFGLDSAIELDKLLADPSKLLPSLQPIRNALPTWPVLDLPKSWERSVLNGQSIPLDVLPKVPDSITQAILMSSGCELALVQREILGATSVWRVTRGLWNSPK
ncbi:MAG: tRNA pseudouridine(55) synthase TruB [Desulfovibrionaceae bacterium]|nr:tRNA pseudouridine(55) synthase TruB [Desulfovibrionaceae bacterium]